VLDRPKGNLLVMMVEDLSLVRSSSLELLQLLGEQGATAPLMLYTPRVLSFAPAVADARTS